MSDANLSLGEKLYMGVQLTRPLLRAITTRVEADLSGSGISVGQRAILEVLLQKDLATAPEITAELQVTRQFVSRELKELLKMDMVLSAANPKNSRSPYYHLSENCRQRILAIRNREMEQFSSFASQFSPKEIDAYLKIQQALNEALSSTSSNPVRAHPGHGQ